MSQPPEYPGSRRLKRAAASAGGSAYQGVFEAVGSILIACGVGYWVDRRFETAPMGVLIGAGIGFAAFVLRLIRLGKQLHPDVLGLEEDTSVEDGPAGPDVGDDRASGESPGLSEALRSDENERSDSPATAARPERDEDDERRGG